MSSTVEQRLISALEAIRDYEPGQDYTPVDNADCPECPKWANHPIQKMCTEHSDQAIGRQARNRDAYNRMGWHLKVMADAALSEIGIHR